MIDCIYLMGGVGKRAKLGYPKQFVYLGGKPLFMHGLDILLNIKKIQNIIIPTSEIKKTVDHLNILDFFEITTFSDIDSLELKFLSGNDSNKNLMLLKNGNSRQESVKKALEKVETEYVLISEAVRPFITKELVNKVLETDLDIVTPVSTMKATPVNKTYGMTYNREDIGEVQMPQKFKTSLLLEAYEKIERLGYLDELERYTDDCDLVNLVLGNEIYSIAGIEENIKVTTPLDIKIAKAIYKYKFGDKDE